MPPLVQLGVSVDISAVDKMLVKLGSKTTDLRPVFHDVIDPSVSKFFERQFETEGGEGGQKWKQLSALTKKLRTRSGHGRGGILRDTNTMWSSFISGFGPMSVRRVERQEMERGSRDRKAYLHQTGWKTSTIFGRKRKKSIRVPARPIVPKTMPPSLVTMWEGALSAFILGS
jgi:hypothetical protein